MPREAQVLVKPGRPRSMEAKRRRLWRVELLVALWARPALKALILDLMTLSPGSPVSARLAGGGQEDRVVGCRCRETGDGQFFSSTLYRTKEILFLDFVMLFQGTSAASRRRALCQLGTEQ